MRSLQENTDPGDVKSRRLALAIAFAVTFLDVVMKYFAVTSFPSEEVAAFPFGIALHKNPGIAFDVPIPYLIIMPVTLILLAALANYARANWTNLPAAACYAVIIFLGAANNLIDRALNGFTTDYIILFKLSAINLADILIILGAIGLLSYTRNNPSTRTM